MNTWSLFVLIFGLVNLAGLFMLVRSALTAPTGYENEQGFHLEHDSPAAPIPFDTTERTFDGTLGRAS